MRNIKILKFYLIAFLISCFLCSNAQRFDSILSKLNNEYKQEKLYLHFDRTVYSPGETIWFKAYLFAGNFPSLISKTVYAELLDDKGKVLDRKTAPLLSSSAAASFDLPTGLNGSYVYVRAYTKWMLNFDSSFIYSKAITVAAPPKPSGKLPSSSPSKTNSITAISPLYYLQFFPEGGDLAEGIESRIAFKATDRFGMPVNVNGNILDKNGKTITSFSSVHDGMGTFLLQPAGAEQYKAIWKNKQGQSHETLLPIAKQNGIVLEVNSNVNQIEFKIKRSANASPYPYVYVVAQMNQQLLYRAKANMIKNASVSSIIPIETFPAGIVQLTLFTPDEKPIAERIVFINQSGYSFITDLNAVLKGMDKKTKNVLQIDVPDTIACNLSVSVTDADLNPQQENDNIFSHVLLTSEIKGYVNDPAYYFSGDADSLADHLDLVMMTNGWRRFNWENVLANRWPKLLYPPENYIAIEGQVHGLNKTLLANKEMNAIIELKNKKRDFMNTPVEPGGKFVFPDMIFYDTARFFYQFNNDKKKDLTSRATFDIKDNLLKAPLRLNPDSSLLLSLTKTDTATLTKNIEVYKEQLSEQQLQKVKTLKEVVVTVRQKTKKELMDEQYTSGLFSGGDARMFLAEDDPAMLSSQSVLDYLQSRVAGLQVYTGANPSISWRGSPTTLFMNEIETDIAGIQNISMSDVAMIKAFSPPFFGAFGGGAGGAVAVYLKKGASGNGRERGLDYAAIAGYSPVKEFYSPDYSKTNSDSSDYRKTLYWNPFVVTDKNHRRIFLSFYNNDITKKMKVVIEGCNEEGKLTRVEKVLQ